MSHNHEHHIAHGFAIQHVHSSESFALTSVGRSPAVDSQALRGGGALSASIAATSISGVAAGRSNGVEIS